MAVFAGSLTGLLVAYVDLYHLNSVIIMKGLSSRLFFNVPILLVSINEDTRANHL